MSKDNIITINNSPEQIFNSLKEKIDDNTISTQQIFNTINHTPEEKQLLFFNTTVSYLANSPNFNLDKKVLIESTEHMISKFQDMTSFLTICSSSEANEDFPKGQELVDIIKDKQISNPSVVDMWFAIEFIIQPRKHDLTGQHYIQILKNYIDTNQLKLNETIATHFILNSNSLNLSNQDKKYLLSTYQQDKTLQSTSVNVAGIVIEYNKTNNINLTTEQIQQILFKTPKNRTDLQGNPILSSILKHNESEKLNIDNQFIIGLAHSNKTIYAQDLNGNNLIHQSLLVNNTECAKAFIKNKNDLSTKNNQGQTVLDIAIEHKNKNFIEYCEQLLDIKNTVSLDMTLYKKQNSIYHNIPVFEQSPYQSYTQLKDLKDNNDMTSKQFKDFFLDINSPSIQQKIIECYISDKENNLSVNPNLYFEFFDVAMEIPVLSSNIVKNMLSDNDCLSGQEKNLLIKKTNEKEWPEFFNQEMSFHFYNYGNNYSKQDVFDLLNYLQIEKNQNLNYKMTIDILDKNIYNDNWILDDIENLCLNTDLDDENFVNNGSEEILGKVINYIKEKNIQPEAKNILNIINHLHLDSKYYNSTPLMMIIENNNILNLSNEDIKEIVSKSDINHQIQDKQNALALAIEHNSEIAQHLVQQGANLNQPIGKYNNIIDYAQGEGYTDFIKFCKENDFILDIPEKSNNKVVSISKIKKK